MNNSTEFLKSFLNHSIYFLGNKALQKKAWENASGEAHFGGCLLCSFEDWATIIEYKKNFKLSTSQFNAIQKLFDMIEDFQKTIDYPTKPNEYRALLNNTEWKKIQDYAQNLYNTVGSRI